MRLAVLGCLCGLAAGLCPAASLAGCTPVRWPWAEARTLELLEPGTFDCLLIERAQCSAEFTSAARARGLRTLAIVRERAGLAESVSSALKAGLDGVVLQGDFDAPSVTEAARHAPVAAIVPRRAMAGVAAADVAGTAEALWPSIRILGSDGAVAAGPSRGPWIDTNSGFLRFAAARTVWLANVPPEGRALRAEDYGIAMADALLGGAVWVAALDHDLAARLHAGDAQARAVWKRVGEYARFARQQRAWLELKPAGGVVVIQDEASGALYSGGLLDMLGTRHIPLRAYAPGAEARAAAESAALVVDMPRWLARSGSLMPAEGWRSPRAAGFALEPKALTEADYRQLSQLWDGVSFAVARRNLGVRVFNGSGMLSSLRAGGTRLTGEPLVQQPCMLSSLRAGGTRSAVVLVNYTGYPVEAVTLQFPGAVKTARLLAPGRQPVKLERYELEQGGTGVDVARMEHLAIVVIE